jgi:hypothetical protein
VQHIEGTGVSKMLVPVFHTTWCHITEDHNLDITACANLRCHIHVCCLQYWLSLRGRLVQVVKKKIVCCSKPQLPATAAATAGTVPTPATPLVVTPTTPTAPIPNGVDQVKTEDTKQTPQPHAVADGELSHFM